MRQASFVWYSTYLKGLELLCNEHILIMVLYDSVSDEKSCKWDSCKQMLVKKGAENNDSMQSQRKRTQVQGKG